MKRFLAFGFLLLAGAATSKAEGTYSRCCKLRKDVNLTRKLSCSTFSDTRLFPTARPLIRRALMLIAKWKVGPRLWPIVWVMARHQGGQLPGASQAGGTVRVAARTIAEGDCSLPPTRAVTCHA